MQKTNAYIIYLLIYSIALQG